MELFVFIPVLVGSIIGLASVLQLFTRCGHLQADNPNLLNRAAQMLAAGNKERAIILLEEDKHPISSLLSFTLSLSLKDPNELHHAYEYAREEIRRRLTKGTSALAWLTIAIPVATILIWLIMPQKPSHLLNLVLIWAVIAEILFWNSTLFYVKLKTMSILTRADDHFKFFSGLFMASKPEEKDVNIEGLVEDTEDVVDIAAGLKTNRRTMKKGMKQV